MHVARAFMEAVLRPVSEAEAIQGALSEQRQLDLFLITCPLCKGLGAVEDLANRWYQCPGMCPFADEEGHDNDPERHCPRCELMVGTKVCPECEGAGYNR